MFASEKDSRWLIAKMNLMFRKNFSAEKTIGSSSGGGKAKGALGAGRNAKRRDRGYSSMEEHHYRTHLFFSAPRASTQYNEGTGNINYFYPNPCKQNIISNSTESKSIQPFRSTYILNKH